MTQITYPLHHVGIAVSDMESSIQAYERNFGFSMILEERLDDRGIHLVFLQLSNTLIELLAPLNDSSVIRKFLEEKGPGIHHICYQVKDIGVALLRMKELGHTLIDKLPREGAAGSLIAFIHPKSMGGVLVELCQPRV